ncbi:NAD(P)H-dependent oxidoreductase [Eisenbergiella sp.]
MKITCISGSNILNSKAESTSLQLCAVISQIAARKRISCEIIDLRSYELSPCTGCGCCFSARRCHIDAGFNEIYEKLTLSDCVFFISPHYAIKYLYKNVLGR